MRIASGNTSPAFPHPTHTCLPIPQTLKGRRVMVVADEDVAKLWPSAPAFTWIYDITNEYCPVPISTFQVEGLDPDGAPQPPMMGCHQPSERSRGPSSRSPGSRRDCGSSISRIRSHRESRILRIDPPQGFSLASSNDVTIDDRACAI